MSYVGLDMVRDPSNDHLGGNIGAGDPFCMSPRAWQYMIDRFGVRSVLDIGSGEGYAAQWFHCRGCQVVAVDGLRQNVERSIYPAICLDLTKGPVVCKVDMVHCVEVVEHVSAEFLDNVLDSLCCGRFLFMTSAIPGQGGHHHVNEQPQEYWINHLRSRGMVKAEHDTNMIKKLAEQDGAVHIVRTGLVMINGNR